MTRHVARRWMSKRDGPHLLEVVETEPAMKGQTAASSYKPALLSSPCLALRSRPGPL